MNGRCNMFKATRPFSDTISTHPKEPSLRIGRTVPPEAVNLAYYYNPVATDAEKVLTSDAPRNTVDHRIEEGYRYLFNKAVADDNLFPGFITYEDEEGYSGKLGRMYVQWNKDAHIEIESATKTETYYLPRKNKDSIPKSYEYKKDSRGYEGTLYLDTVTYEESKTEKIPKTEVLDRQINNYEISYYDIYGHYMPASEVDKWMKSPKKGGLWPSGITINDGNCGVVGSCNTDVKNFIKGRPNTLDQATGTLSFSDGPNLDIVEDPDSPTNETSKITEIDLDGVTILSRTFKYDKAKADSNLSIQEKIDKMEKFMSKQLEDLIGDEVQGSYLAEFDDTSYIYKYDAIKEFLYLLSGADGDPSNAERQINDAITSKYSDICIQMESSEIVVDQETELYTKFHFEFKYKGKISSGISFGSHLYNVTVSYAGLLKKTITSYKEVISEYKATATYVGVIRMVWYDYDGMAYYRGAVTKGNAIGNMNVTDDNEILMYSDAEGVLRRPFPDLDEEGNQRVDANGIPKVKNYTRVEADFVYLTDVFKDGVACFYKHTLKKPIYDYRGPDERGFYEGDAVKIFTSNFKDIPNTYKHALKLTIEETETTKELIDNKLQDVERPLRYRADLFTSFISSSTDTFKVTYNAYDDNDKDNVALDNGVTEDIYNYPYMVQNRDYFVEAIDTNLRVNRIRLAQPLRIRDTRRYVRFSFRVIAEHQDLPSISNNNNVIPYKKFMSPWMQADILNKDYALAVEYEKFVDRAMIISPMSDGVYLSPKDIILKTISGLDVSGDYNNVLKSPELIYYIEVNNTEEDSLVIGGVNVYCNPDGSGYVLAETTIDTGFLDDNTETYTKKLVFNNPYYVERGSYIHEDPISKKKEELPCTWIYPGIKVKCVDSRQITVLPPREEGLLESWHPRIQFGHYSQIMDQYHTHTKVSYSMPEYDLQHYSPKFKRPYVDIVEEPVTIINSHMVKTKCYPLFINDINMDENTYYKFGKYYRLYSKPTTWKQAKEFCENANGCLASIKTPKENDFFVEILKKTTLPSAWVGGTDEMQEGTWYWLDDPLQTPMTYTNWAPGEPNQTGGNEDYMCIYNNGTWNDYNDSHKLNGFICSFEPFNTIKLYKKVDNVLYEVKIKDVSFSDGIIITDEAISENDNIVCTYTYIEESYVYRGFWRNKSDFARIDLNPNMYHTYSDLTYTPSEDKPSKNLFNKVIYFFLKPTIICEVDPDYNSMVVDREDDSMIKDVVQLNKACIYHQIDNPMPQSSVDIQIGSVYIRQNTSLHSTVLVDSRTRGGGIIESMKDDLRHELEPDSDYYLDIGYYDGEPYQENGVIIIRLDKKVLKEFGGMFTQGDVEQKVKRWLGLGVYPIIEYVDTYNKYDMPQYSLVVEDTYSNVIDITPEIYLECKRD